MSRQAVLVLLALAAVAVAGRRAGHEPGRGADRGHGHAHRRHDPGQPGQRHRGERRGVGRRRQRGGGPGKGGRGVGSDNGTAGSVQSVSLRGSASAQVLVLVDGVRLNDSRQGAPDLSQIPVEIIERIEIVRGGTSALYGADAVGGVVNIITKDKAEDRFRLSLTNGSYLPRDAVDDGIGAQSAPVGGGTTWTWWTRSGSRAQLSQAWGRWICWLTGSFTRANNGFVWHDEQVRRRLPAASKGQLLEADGSLCRLPLQRGRAVWG